MDWNGKIKYREKGEGVRILKKTAKIKYHLRNSNEI